MFRHAFNNYVDRLTDLVSDNVSIRLVDSHCVGILIPSRIGRFQILGLNSIAFRNYIFHQVQNFYRRKSSDLRKLKIPNFSPNPGFSIHEKPIEIENLCDFFLPGDSCYLQSARSRA